MTAEIREGVRERMIALLPSGHLPTGRHPSTLGEVEADFVLDPRFAKSSTRVAIWNGFIQYLGAWKLAEDALNARLLRAVWIAGSFASSTLDPDDIDVTPLYDDSALRSAASQPGVGAVKKLLKHRDSVVRDFRVQAFPVGWRSIASTMFPERLLPVEQTYLLQRGGMDDWWGRLRPDGEKRAPLPPSRLAERGYLEVLL